MLCGLRNTCDIVKQQNLLMCSLLRAYLANFNPHFLGIYCTCNKEFQRKEEQKKIEYVLEQDRTLSERFQVERTTHWITHAMHT